MLMENISVNQYKKIFRETKKCSISQKMHFCWRRVSEEGVVTREGMGAALYRGAVCG